MLRHISLRKLFVVSWLIAFGAIYALRFIHGLRRGEEWGTDWQFAAIGAVGVAGLITLIIKRLQDEPTKEEREAFWALFNSEPGVVGVVLVTKNGVPEVIATVAGGLGNDLLGKALTRVIHSGTMSSTLPSIYDELASWFHLLTHPREYAEEAAAYRDALLSASAVRPRTLLELGSGGGNNAFYLKRDFECTLSDLSPAMIELSRGLNPECEHVVGDMRTLRLGRQFDAVFVHDAVMYMTTEDDLRRAMETAFIHCRPGGVALFALDYTRETFQPLTEHGGNDGEGRALRYLEWDWDPDPNDTTFLVDFVYMLREGDTEVRVVHDRHVCGIFPRNTWLRLLGETGFQVRSATRPVEGEEVSEIFVALRP